MQQHSSEAIRQSLEALDQVLDQFDPGSIKADHGLKVVLRPKDSVREAVYQSLSFLDGVLAEFETEETEITKDKDHDPLPSSLTHAEPKNLHLGDSSGKIASVKKSPAPTPPGSPLSSPKVSLTSGGVFYGPPVPKRSPTTCLSTSSLGGEGPPTPDPLQEDPFPSSTAANLDDLAKRKQKEEESGESSGTLLSGEESGGEKVGSGGRGRKFSGRPVQMGASRTKLRQHSRKLKSDEKPDDKSSDDVFLNDIQHKPPSLASKTSVMAAPFEHFDRFAIIKRLLLTGELPGLDEPPPSFKPPPLPPNKNNTESADPNGNLAQAVHVTSVKITPNVSNPSVAPPNISVITIQAKNNTTNDAACQQRTNVPQTRKKMSANHTTRTAEVVPDNSKKPEATSNQLNNVNNNNGAEPRLKMSTFNRDLPSPVSSSQEDLCKSNSSSLERKPLAQPEVRHISGPVFFNVFQSDGTPSPDGTVVLPESENKKEVEVSKKKGWMLRKSKKGNNPQAAKAKDETKEAPPSDNHEMLAGPPVAMAEKALLAELSGRLRRAPSPPKDKAPAVAPPLATMDDSDEETSEQNPTQQQGPRTNKDEKSKWKIWRKKGEGKAEQ